MEFVDVAAVLGALAWTPHLISVARNYFTKSKIRIITNKTAEIGFTTYGPIFNLRIAFSVENKDIVVSDLIVKLKHESGEERVFAWQGITQSVGKMTTPEATVPFEKEQSVLAVKLNQFNIEELFIRCQEPKFIAEKQEIESIAVEKLTYLKDENQFEIASFLRSQEMIDLYKYNKQAFPWKAGKYTLTFELSSPQDFTLVDNERTFLLSTLDVEELSKNKDMIESEYRRNVPGGEEKEGVKWEWRYPQLIKT
ncbi:hypothetical protein [Vibrio sp. 1180_3]|uniref:hypothetical protein n=1 Tax=Vibrio sp. 1180_3 TaxID=2528832 RepID=UPI002404D93E|nr:hypothetical protein [Vibrio sp. 1180_3]MDF9401588.1 hypothetical protein [Vibrio sp. 1180_3]